MYFSPCRRYVVIKASVGFAVCRLILKTVLFYSCLDFTQNLGVTLFSWKNTSLVTRESRSTFALLLPRTSSCAFTMPASRSVWTPLRAQFNTKKSNVCDLTRGPQIAQYVCPQIDQHRVQGLMHKSLRKPHVHGVLAPPCRESNPTFTH